MKTQDTRHNHTCAMCLVSCDLCLSVTCVFWARMRNSMKFFLVSVFTLLISDFILFCLTFFVFWTVRSIGEQIYWFLEQFATNHRNLEHTLWASRFFPRNSVWIANQIFWQCVSVVAIIASMYFFVKWLN